MLHLKTKRRKILTMPAAKYSVEHTNFSDVEKEVLSLWESNGFTNRKNLLDWAFGKNFSRPTENSMFFVLTQESSIVGCCGVVERKIRLFGEECSCGYPNNFLVDINHRSLGPAIQIQKNILDQKSYQVIFAVPNKKSDGVLRRVGYKPIGKMERWVLVVRTEKYLKKILKALVLAKIAAVFTDFIIYAKIAFVKTSKKGLNIHIIENFDDRFNGFWEKDKSNHAIIGERNSNYLKWRFSNYPINTYKIFTLQNSNNELLAYLVYSNLKSGYYIDDLLTENEEMYICLLKEFVKFSKKQGKEAITFRFFGDPRIYSALKKVGFKRRSDSNSVLVFSNFKNDDVFNKDKWFLTAADMDV
jgi:hypothetical protein